MKFNESINNVIIHMINMIVNLIEKHHLSNKMESILTYFGFIINFFIPIMIENIFKTIRLNKFIINLISNQNK